MNILGIGILCAHGRGIDAYDRALRRGWREPAAVTVRDRNYPVYQVELERAQDKALLKKMRRSDKLSKMAVLAASDALESSGIGDEDKKRPGIIVATAFGAHATTFDFLDGVLDYGEAAVSPTVFSNSVHNAAASYISSVLEVRAPTVTVTQFYFCFQYALQLARAWLNEGRVDHVLVGAVDQYGEVLGYVYDSKLMTAQDGRIRPFRFNPTAAVPGEGAVFFLMSNKQSDRALCRVDDIRFGRDLGGGERADMDIIDADGMLADESLYASALLPDTPAASYSPVFGSMMIGSAFSCAAGALMLRDQVRYANPVSDNPRGLNLVAETTRAPIEFIRCIRYNCYGEKAVISLEKK